MQDLPKLIPFSAGTASPAATLPELACDCHMHVFDAGFPAIPNAPVVAPDASASDYRLLCERLGVERNIVVQPSVYGLDNSLLLRTLALGGDNMRGVAVVNDQVSDTELRYLNASGVVGIRFNQVQKGATELSMLTTLGPRLIKLGWHVQMHLTAQQVLDNASAIAEAGFPVVLDHFARICADEMTSPHVQKIIFKLMRKKTVWLKLTAPYLASTSGAPNFSDLSPLVKRLTDEFPDQLVWGTDWPHATESDMPDDAKLIDWLDLTLGTAESKKAVFADNPNRLYRFA
jgi:D-galactarolactone isomerase